MKFAIHSAIIKGFETKTIFKIMNNKYITWTVKPTIFMIPICSSNLLILKSSISSDMLFVLSILEYIRQIIHDLSIDGCKTSSGTYSGREQVQQYIKNINISKSETTVTTTFECH
jgi:hypothetical protein